MLRRPLETIVILAATTTAISFLDATNADAQGILRRLRSRIESRVAPVPPPPTSGQPNNANRPAEAGQPNDATPSGRRRLLPITPADPNQPKRTPLTGRDPDSRVFGGSILAPLRDQAQPAAQANDRPSLGIEVIHSKSNVPGLEVVKFREDTLARDAGLRVGDIIISIDGVPTPKTTDVAGLLKDKRPGDKLQTKVVRGNTTQDILLPLVGNRVTAAKPDANSPQVATRPPAPPLPSVDQANRLGVEVGQADGARGVRVSQVVPGSPAAAAGVQVDDRIVAINGLVISDPNAFEQRLARRGNNETVSFRLVRDGNLVNTDVDLSGKSVGTLAAGDDQPADAGQAQEPSTLQGIGSLLGGFFGNGENGNSTESTGNKPSADSKAKSAPSQKDVMSLDDGEPIRRVGYDEAVPASDANKQADSKPAVKQPQDPPSLELLPEKPASKQDAAARLRAEILRLQQQLKELETKQDPEPTKED